MLLLVCLLGGARSLETFGVEIIGRMVEDGFKGQESWEVRSSRTILPARSHEAACLNRPKIFNECDVYFG